jgi:hypothetical protein
MYHVLERWEIHTEFSVGNPEREYYFGDIG